MASINIALDAMGGDDAPASAVLGALDALGEKKDFSVTLVGCERAIAKELSHAKSFTNSRLKIRHASEVIFTDETPTKAVREKKDSSMVVALSMVKEGSAGAIVSAGSTGALLTGGLLVIGRVRGILRPAFGVMIPSIKKESFGHTFLIDAGANMDSKPEFLAQFAKLGNVYVESLFGMSAPRVGLLNVGVEAEKGSALVKEANPLLADCGVNYIGYVEARDISLGDIDVAVCDGFVGNIVLKHSEGFAKAMGEAIKREMMASVSTKIAGLLSKKVFRNVRANFSASEIGGAPFLGLKGLVVKAHGNSDRVAFKNAILMAVRYAQTGVQEKILELGATSEHLTD